MSETMLDKYLKLPKEVQIQVLDYIDFLVAKYQEKFSKKPVNKRKSNFGSAKGLIVMHDDFDAPLEDFNN